MFIACTTSPSKLASLAPVTTPWTYTQNIMKYMHKWYAFTAARQCRSFPIPIHTYFSAPKSPTYHTTNKSIRVTYGVGEGNNRWGYHQKACSSAARRHFAAAASPAAPLRSVSIKFGTRTIRGRPAQDHSKSNYAELLLLFIRMKLQRCFRRGAYLTGVLAKP